MAIIATLCAIAIPLTSDLLERFRVARVITDIQVFESEIAVFELLNGRLPDDLAEIGRGATRDAWGNTYEYLNFSAADDPGKGKDKDQEKAKVRKDHNLHPLNSTYDLYSKGKDGKSNAPLTAQASRDDIIRANDGGYVGLASGY